MNYSEAGDPLTYQIIGSAYRVHAELGHGFLEAVYQEALELEFIKHEIPYQREVKLAVYYSGNKLTTFYQADFVC